MSAAVHRSMTSGKATPSPTRRIASRPLPERRLSMFGLAAGAPSSDNAPAVFGLAGAALGTVAIAKGDKSGGMAGIGANSALAVTGSYLALNLTA